jgi:transposase
VTKRLAESVVQLCEVLPIQHVAQHYGMNWNTVKRIHSDITVIGMDEFAIQKGHRYATVIVDMDTKRVLWVGRGRGREDIRPFFHLLGEEGCKRLEAVTMDMNGAYEEEVRSHCPDVEIIYDLYHVKAKYNRDVIERVRIDELGRVRGGQPGRKVTQNERWLLLRNNENVTDKEDRVLLTELLSANKRLYKAYILKEDLSHLWSYRSKAAAERFWKQWYRRAMYSKIEALKKFARNLKTYIPGVLAHCTYPFGTNLIEGINNKIKVIKRMAYGFRDDVYFFLRIRHAFPGNR